MENIASMLLEKLSRASFVLTIAYALEFKEGLCSNLAL